MSSYYLAISIISLNTLLGTHNSTLTFPNREHCNWYHIRWLEPLLGKVACLSVQPQANQPLRQACSYNLPSPVLYGQRPSFRAGERHAIALQANGGIRPTNRLTGHVELTSMMRTAPGTVLV
jgi:hypothetical protein